MATNSTKRSKDYSAWTIANYSELKNYIEKESITKEKVNFSRIYEAMKAEYKAFNKNAAEEIKKLIESTSEK